MNRPNYCFEKNNCFEKEEKTCFHILDQKNEEKNGINDSFFEKWILMYGANGSGKTILAHDLKKFVENQKNENLIIKVFSEKFIQDNCYIYDQKHDETKASIENKKILTKNLIIKNDEIKEAEKKLEKIKLISGAIILPSKKNNIKNFFITHIEKIFKNNKFEKCFQKIKKEIEDIEFLDFKCKKKYNKFRKKYENFEKNSEELSKEIEEDILSEIPKKFEINDKDKNKIYNFSSKKNIKIFLEKFDGFKTKLTSFNENLLTINKLNIEINNFKKIWEKIAKKIFETTTEKIDYDFKIKFIKWHKKGKSFYDDYKNINKNCCIFCSKKKYSRFKEVEELTTKKLINDKNKIIKDQKILKKKIIEILEDANNSKELFIEQEKEQKKYFNKYDNLIKNSISFIKEINLDLEKIIIKKKEEEEFNELINLIENEKKNINKNKESLCESLDLIKNQKKYFEKFNFISLIKEEKKETEKQIEEKCQNLKIKINKEIDCLTEIWNLKKINFEISYDKKSKVLLLNYKDKKIFKNLSTGERKAVAIILFFLSVKEEIEKNNNSNFILVFDDVLDQLDFKANFKISRLLLEYIRNNEELNKKIKCKIFLTHQLEFINFFIYLKRDYLSKSFNFFLFQKRKKNVFLLKLDFVKIFQNDLLIFKKYFKKICSDPTKFNILIFWTLWRKAIEKILTSQVNINEGKSVEINNNNNCFKQFETNCEKIFKNENEKKNFLEILKKWKGIIISKDGEIVEIDRKKVKNMIKGTFDFLKEIKFIIENKKEEINEKINEVDLKISISEIENEIEKINEKVFEENLNKKNGQPKKENEIEANYQESFLLCLGKFFLKNLINKKNKTNEKKTKEKFVFFRHANNNLFPELFSYNKETFEMILKLNDQKTKKNE